MRTLSCWASRHTQLAILMIILGEVANGINGVLLGANLLNYVSLSWLYFGMALLICLASFVQRQVRCANVSANYWVSRKWLFTAFLTNYLLFGLLGGIWGHQIGARNSTNTVLGNRRMDIVRDTIPASDSIRLKNRPVIKATAVSEQPSGHRGLFVGLGIIGILLATYLAGLACGIACAGYGFAAVLVFYLGVGSMAGAVYFFSRAGSNPFKRRRDMTPEERRRDSKHFWIPLAILVGIFSIIFLSAAVSK